MTFKMIYMWIANALVLSMLAGGCTGIKPYEPHNYREEGPKRGVFTGAEGEFVIIGQEKIIQPGGDAENSSNDNTEGSY